MTGEVFDKIWPKHNANQRRQYEFEMGCQGASLTMQIRGIKIDHDKRKQLAIELHKDGMEGRKRLDALGAKWHYNFKWGEGFGPSSQQLAKLLVLLGAEVPSTDKGNPSLDKTVLKRFAGLKNDVGAAARETLQLRDWQKQHEICEKGVGVDGRFRFTMAIGQTETGRSSSYKDCYGQGDNIQNKAGRMRFMFIPDVGMKMWNVDLSQGESNAIAHLAGDERYIEAHVRGNVHVDAARVFWPNFSWSKDDKENKDLLKHTPAEWIPQPKPGPGALPAWSYYDMSKRGQHGLNYGLKFGGLAKWLGCKSQAAREYVARYFEAYPYIKGYQEWVANQIATVRALSTPLGMERRFFGRSWTDETVREGLAFTPQSLIGQIGWLGTWRIWKRYDPQRIWVLQNGHDSALVEAKIGDDVSKELMECFTVEVPVTDYRQEKTRMMVIKSEVGSGMNWKECK